jgi:hypothetical protein
LIRKIEREREWRGKRPCKREKREKKGSVVDNGNISSFLLFLLV